MTSPSAPRNAVLLVTGLLLIAASTASAQDNLIRVRDLEITGTQAVPASRLKAVLQTRESGRFFWGRKRYFDRRRFEADLRRIEAYYADRGYPDARVASFDATLSSDQRSIDLTVVVNEGEPVIVDEVRLEGLAGLTDDEIKDLQGNLPLVPGRLRDRAVIDNARGMVARELQDHGYPFSRVAVEERPGSMDRHVTIALVGLVGEAATFGPVSIEGMPSVGEDIIRRALAFKTGEPFSLQRIQQSQRRLYDMDLFRLVNIENATEGVENGTVPIRVTVAESDHREIQFSAGYGSEERLRGETLLRHLNFLGGTRTASVEAKWSSLDRGIRTEFRQPHLLGPDTSLSLSAQRWFANERAYQLHTRGGRATLSHELSRPTNVVSGRGTSSTLSASWIYERETFSISPEALADLTLRNQLIALGLDPRTGEGTGLLNALAVDFRRSTTASVLDSTRGYVFQAHAERGGGWLPGDYDYFELSVEGRHYQTLGRFGVLAHRAHVASIATRGIQDFSVPFFKRYFLGGSDSLRGWGRFEVSPLSDSGLPIGGHSLVELSSELRMPLFGRVGLVTFVDAGIVRPDSWDVGLSDLQYDVGPGLRYASPIGPLRVDLAYQVNRIPGLLVDGVPEPRRWRIHFSIGQTF